MYYIITRNQELFAVCFSSPYDLALDSTYSIHEMELPCPDLNTSQWDDSTGEWIDNPSRMTKLSFLNRFTMVERIAIRSSTDPIVYDIMQLFDAAEYISLTDTNTMQGIGYLATIGILTGARATEILT